MFLDQSVVHTWRTFFCRAGLFSGVIVHSGFPTASYSVHPASTDLHDYVTQVGPVISSHPISTRRNICQRYPISASCCTMKMISLRKLNLNVSPYIDIFHLISKSLCKNLKPSLTTLHVFLRVEICNVIHSSFKLLTKFNPARKCKALGLCMFVSVDKGLRRSEPSQN